MHNAHENYQYHQIHLRSKKKIKSDDTLQKRIYVSTSPKRETTEMRDDDVEPGKEKSSKNGEGAFLACAQLTSVLVKIILGLQAKLLLLMVMRKCASFMVKKFNEINLIHEKFD